MLISKQRLKRPISFNLLSVIRPYIFALTSVYPPQTFSQTHLNSNRCQNTSSPRSRVWRIHRMSYRLGFLWRTRETTLLRSWAERKVSINGLSHRSWSILPRLMRRTTLARKWDISHSFFLDYWSICAVDMDQVWQHVRDGLCEVFVFSAHVGTINRINIGFDPLPSHLGGVYQRVFPFICSGWYPVCWSQNRLLCQVSVKFDFFLLVIF